MTIFSSASLSPWSMVFRVAAHLTAGILLGVLCFRSLWWNARLLTSGGRITTTIAFILGRFAVLGGLLTLASFECALPLLSTALGVLIARPLVMRRVREAVP